MAMDEALYGEARARFAAELARHGASLPQRVALLRREGARLEERALAQARRRSV